jgi:hypothetical protein
MVSPNFKFYSFICIVLLLTSCIKDTDFSQSEDISLSPVMEFNLIYFDIEAPKFFDEIEGEALLTVRDTTALNFINGTDTQEVLKKVEFFFDFTNSIPRIFEITFDFLTEENELVYSLNTIVFPGSNTLSRQTIFIKEIALQDLEQLTMSTKVLSVVTIPASDQELTGSLNLKSKATYYLEIDL